MRHFRIVPMLSIRPATLPDVPHLVALIRELAEYERLSHKVRVAEADLARDGFGSNPKFRAIIAESDGQAAGYALFFEFYSTFQGRPGLYLEDLFVRPQFRRSGIGRALLAHVAGIAWKEKYFSLRWAVLDWNEPAIDFYRKLGADFLDEWKTVSLTGDALQGIAEHSRQTK